jgi:signal transduction histidine kinase
MTSTQFDPNETPSEILDLYDDLPTEAERLPREQNEPMSGLLIRSGRNFAVLVGMFAVHLTAFIVCTTLFSLGLGLAVLFFGLFVLVGCLVVAGWASRMSRGLLGYAGIDLPPTRYPVSSPGLRGHLRRLGHAQSWRDLLHVLVSFILSTITFSIAVSWVAGAFGGLSYWYWSRFLHPQNTGLPALVGFPGHFADLMFNTIVGGVLLLTTPIVLHGLVRLHAAAAYALIVDEASELRQQVSELTVSRTAAGEAEVHTLRRLERDLHDGPQQRLVRLGMDISAAQRRLDDDPARARALLDEALQQSQDALSEIRTLSRGIAPPILVEQGLGPAVTALAARGSIPTLVEVQEVRLSEAGQNAAYFVVAETLANLEKHSRARHAAVEVHRVGALAVINVTDDGVGGASLAKGHGLAGLADRLAGVDGTLNVSSPAGGPTLVTATIPQHLG